MRRLVASLAAALSLAFVVVLPSAAAVQCEPGRMFAQDHIVPAADAGMLGRDTNPGMHHGFSVCVRQP
jgi:hypothetical protein